MATNAVLFKFGTQEAYDCLGEGRPSNALYFIENTHRLYKGDVLMSKPYLIVSSVPDAANALEDVFYVVIKDDSASMYIKHNGGMVVISNGNSGTIGEGSIKDLDAFADDLLSTSKDTLGESDDKLVTEGAVKKAIDEAIKDSCKSLLWSPIEE